MRKTPYRPGRDDPRYKAARLELKAYDHTCHHCGYPIDMPLAYPHPLSWSSDHIVPTSQMTHDDIRQWHISNMRALHMRCNQSRGAKPAPHTQGLNTSQQW